MTQAEIEAAVSRLGQQIAKLQEQQDAQKQDWRQLAARSGWLSIACVCIGAIFAIALLVVTPNFYLLAVMVLSLFMLTSAPLGLLSRALGVRRVKQD
jgi:membrane glycosyltransferase